MTFRVSLLIDADGKAAVTSIKRVGDAMRQTKGEIQRVSDASQTAAVQNDGLARSNTRVAQSAEKLARSNTIAAGSVGNLTAQFNDIGQMMLAGQNPLTLAVQQGTQISQVLGPMGARGAVTALGSALRGMLNPVSLITIGSIAAGAAMVQWLTSAGEAALTTDDALTKMEESVDAYSEALRRARAPSEELRALYGQMTEEARQDLQLLADIARRDMQRAAAAVSASITDGINTTRPEFGDQQAIAERFDLSLLGRGRQGRQALVNEVLASFQQLDAAGTGSINRQITAFERAIDAYQAAAEAQGGVTAEEDAVLAQLGQQLTQLRQARTEETNTIGASTAALREQVQAQQEITQATIEQRVEAARVQARDDAAAERQLAVLHDEIALRSMINQFGEDSAAVAQLRAQQERVAYEAMLDSSTAAEDLKASVMAAYDANAALAAINTAGQLGAGADQAGRMAGNLSAALSFAQQIAMVEAATPEPPPELGFGLPSAPSDGTGVSLGFGNYRGSNFNGPPRNFGGAGSGGGGGGGGAREERDAVADLIARLQEEADIRNELDPVQQEMIRYREELSDATADQRAEVEALITAQQRETEAAEAAQERWDYFGSTAYDALLSIAKGGDDASDAMRNLASSLAEAVFQAAIMGQGPLGGLFGGTSIFSMIGGALGIGGSLPGKARGGMITGPGDGTSDDVLMWGSAGEMVMNARATAKNRHLLEAMNANAPIRGYAKGGMIGGGGGLVGAAPSGSTGPVQINIDVTGARGNAEIMDMVRSGVEQGMAHYDRAILPTSVQRISSNGRRIG